MEAKLVDELADGPGWQHEPKWDGFRCLASRDGDAAALQSKAGQPLGRYFPGDDGRLHYIGHTSSFSRPERRRVTDEVLPLRGGAGSSGDAPGVSRR